MSWMGIWNGLIRRKTRTRREDPGSVLKVVFCQGEDGFIIAECPQLPGCMSQGRTRKEAMRNIVDAIESVLMARMGRFSPEVDLAGCCGGDYEEERNRSTSGARS